MFPTTCRSSPNTHGNWAPQAEVGDLLVITFSAQGAPVAQGQAEVRALRDAMLKVGHGGTWRGGEAAVALAVRQRRWNPVIFNQF